jgi:hypothetical protein
MTDAATIRWLAGPGNFMCCICFAILPVAEAYVDENGDRWDMCSPCGKENS